MSATVQLLGGEGNDKFDRFTGTSTSLLEIDGGAGNDKIVTGTGFLASEIRAGDGDDVVHDVDEEMNPDAERVFDLGAGNDTFFGGRDGTLVDVDGGDGNDKIFGPNSIDDDQEDDGYG